MSRSPNLYSKLTIPSAIPLKQTVVDRLIICVGRLGHRVDHLSYWVGRLGHWVGHLGHWVVRLGHWVGRLG